MKLTWLRWVFLGPVVLALLTGAADLSIVRIHWPVWLLQADWPWVALIFCAEVSAVLAVARIIQKESAFMTALDVAILFMSLVAYASAGFALFAFSPNNLWLAACSVGIVFAALAIATGRELIQKRTGNIAIESRHAALNRYRRTGPATALMIAALASLPLAILAFAFIDHAMWASLPSNPWRGGDVMSAEQDTRNMILGLAFPVCGSLLNLVMCVILSVYHGRLWKGATAGIVLSAAVLFGAAAQEDLVGGAARKYVLQHSTWDIGYVYGALCGLGWVIIPATFVFMLITHYRLVLKRG